MKTRALRMDTIMRLAHHFGKYNADTIGHAEKRLDIFVALGRHPYTHVQFFEQIRGNEQASQKYMALLQDIDRIT